jgi:hypothetical protein
MRKQASCHEELMPPAARSRRSALMPIVLALPACPLLYEGGQAVTGRWAPLIGVDFQPSTPILDALGDAFRSGSVDAWLASERLLAECRFSPATIIPFAIGWSVVMAALFLRRAA